MEYWISLKGEKQGPLKEWDIRALIEEGKAEPTDLVWHSDLDEWEKLGCLLYTSPSPRDGATSRMPSSA